MWPWITVRLIESKSWNWGTFWQSSSAIATTVGVLIALLTPIFNRRGIRRKVINACMLLIKSIDEISELAAQSDRNSEEEFVVELFNKSTILRTMNFEIWDMYSHEFARYAPEKFIVFQKIVYSARAIQESSISWENSILQKLDPDIEDIFSMRFESRIADLTTVFDENMEYLEKWGVK